MAPAHRRVKELAWHLLQPGGHRQFLYPVSSVQSDSSAILNLPPAEAAANASNLAKERRLALGFILVLALVLGLVGFAAWEGRRYVAAATAVDQSGAIIADLNALVSAVGEAETAQRGYCLMGNEELVSQCVAANESAARHLAAIRARFPAADHSEKSRLVEALTVATNNKLAFVRENLQARQHLASEAIAPPPLAMVVKGGSLMQAVRVAADTLLAAEQRQVNQHRTDRDVHLSGTIISLSALGALLAVICLTGLIVTRRELARRGELSLKLAQARDAALETSRQKSEFLANMSHEIRTPLNGIVGMTGLLMDAKLEPETRDFAQTIETCAEALMTVIDDILDFSKIEAGRLTFEHVDFDLRATIDSAMEILSTRAAAKHLDITSLVRAGVPAGLRGDSSRLRQALLNLMGNAVKFTEKGEISLYVTALAQHSGLPADGSRVALRFEVVDTGIGISDEERERLFRAFSQADGSTTRKYGGTGLGLAISKELVHRMGGDIGVESRPGHGSTFWFTGVFERDPNNTQSAANRPPAAAAALTGLRVLVVDDNPTNRKVLQYQFDAWKISHAVAPDAARAVAQLRIARAEGRPFHVALLDMQMPVVDGPMLAQQIREDAEISDVRMIMMTSVALPPGVSARLRDLHGFLTKPVKSNQLLDALRRAASGLFPITPSAGAEPDADALASVDSGFGADIPRVLLVEDNEVNRKVAQRQIESLGFQAECAQDGREALDLLARSTFDLVLMDCQMPHMDGYETTQAIRQREAAGLVRTPIVAMTAHAMDGDRDRCIAAGMDDYLSKPVKVADLRTVLQRWLPSRRRDRAAVSAAVGEASRESGDN